MPVLADGDYNYEVEPAAAETSADVQVVAIPAEEAEKLSEIVKEIKRRKEENQPKAWRERTSSFGPRNRGNDKVENHSR